MGIPQFFVVARVVGRDGAFPLWKERLVALCEVSATEVQGTAYYWGQDVDGEPDTLWGLEGYSHATGFFLGHPASEIFKAEMAKVDGDKLLRNIQGIGSPDYDLHYYDFFSGFLSRCDDSDKDFKHSFVVVLHYWAVAGKRPQLLDIFSKFADNAKASETNNKITLQSCAVLKECMDLNMLSLYLRFKTKDDWEQFSKSSLYSTLQSDTKIFTTKREIHRSQAFNGHIDKEAASKF